MKTNSKLFLLAFLFCLFVKAISSNGPNPFYEDPKGQAEKIKAKVNAGEIS
jgi:hypothetical protein